MLHRTSLESLEGRRLLTFTTTLADPSVGMIGTEIQTALNYPATINVPHVAADGTIIVDGTSLDDVITVERVTDPALDDNDGEMDFLTYKDPNGNPAWSSGGMHEFLDDQLIQDDRDELAIYKQERDQILAAGHTVPDHLQTQIEQFEAHIAWAEDLAQKLQSGKFIRVTLQGVYDWFYELSDEQAANARIVINGGAGQDNISVSTAVPLKATINGESGSDTLTSGKKLARLNGGGGNDKLVSRSRKGGSLDGGKGADRYYNRGESDIAILARNDGDRIALAAGLTPVQSATSFGASEASQAKKDDKRDLLA